MTPETVTIETPSGLRIVGDHWAGDGDTVVLAHGGGQTRHSWGGTAATLAARGFRVLSIDQRGHGDSDWSPDGDYRLSAFCDDALAVIAWTGAPVAWVGASLGGSTGMHVLAADPTAIDRLVLVDITPRPAMAGVDRIMQFMGANAVDGFASLDEAADAIAAYQPHRPRPTDLSGLAKNLRLGEDGRWRWHWDPAFLSIRGTSVQGSSIQGTEHGRERPPQDLESLARTLHTPTLLVRGRLSDLVTEAEAAEFLALVPHAEYVDVAGAAHMIAGDRNDVFTDAVVSFLDRAGTTTR